MSRSQNGIYYIFLISSQYGSLCVGACVCSDRYIFAHVVVRCLLPCLQPSLSLLFSSFCCRGDDLEESRERGDSRHGGNHCLGPDSGLDVHTLVHIRAQHSSVLLTRLTVDDCPLLGSRVSLLTLAKAQIYHFCILIPLFGLRLFASIIFSQACPFPLEPPNSFGRACVPYLHLKSFPFACIPLFHLSFDNSSSFLRNLCINFIILHV